LEKELVWIAKNNPSPLEIQEILSILIDERQSQPTASHYEALILGNCDPEHGSIASVEIILEEMRDEGITIGASIYAAILKVSPDGLDLAQQN
jgi:hypothetical protein